MSILEGFINECVKCEKNVNILEKDAIIDMAEDRSLS